MEITKQNENYNITDTTSNGWSVSGSATKEESGSVSINFTANTDLGSVGYMNYYKPVDTDVISANYTVSEANRDEFCTYADTVIDTVLTKFAE